MHSCCLWHFMRKIALLIADKYNFPNTYYFLVYS